MRTTNLHWISALSIVAALTACPAEEDPSDTGADESTGGTDDPSASSTMSASETSATMSASTTTATTTTTEPETDSETEPGTISVTMTTTTGEDPLENGEMCDSNDQCISMMCFVVGPLGGICGECLTDADCTDVTGGGCSIPNPLSTPPEGAMCNMGEQGEGCMTDDVCVDEGAVCAVILDVPGILTASTCSECLDDAGCTDGALCSPSYDVAELSGVKTCVPPGSVPDGEGCDLESGTGNDACMSGFCQPADVLGVLELGVCSGCATDEDCTEPEVCLAPTVDLMTGLAAGGCGMME
jgi:hypothetical protein